MQGTRRRRSVSGLPFPESVEIVGQTCLLVELGELRFGFGRPVECSGRRGLADDPVLIEDGNDGVQAALPIGARLAGGGPRERELIREPPGRLLRALRIARVPRAVVLLPVREPFLVD